MIQCDLILFRCHVRSNKALAMHLSTRGRYPVFHGFWDTSGGRGEEMCVGVVEEVLVGHG